MRKIRLTLAALAVSAAALFASAPAAHAYASSGSPPANFAYALNYAQGKCLRYTGCGSMYVGALSWYQTGNITVYQTFQFHTSYCGWKYYDVAIYPNGSIVWQYLHGGSC